MLVKDAMNREVIVAKPEISLKDASKAMVEMDIGSLVVVDEKKISGIITSSDILKAIASGKDPERTLVINTMSKKVKTIDSKKTIEDAVEIMMKNKIKKLPVIDDGKIVGIITASDIISIEPKLIENVASLMSMRVSNATGG